MDEASMYWIGKLSLEIIDWAGICNTSIKLQIYAIFLWNFGNSYQFWLVVQLTLNCFNVKKSFTVIPSVISPFVISSPSKKFLKKNCPLSFPPRI